MDKTALTLAVKKGNVAAVKLLMNVGARTDMYLYEINNSEIKEFIKKDRYR
ncbi:MAG: hypothetical protein K5780_00660 [Alphaproteobacteria bacterium]|nr:hypothetical protein [Alphaproteobacteria bacterium]